MNSITRLKRFAAATLLCLFLAMSIAGCQKSNNAGNAAGNSAGGKRNITSIEVGLEGGSGRATITTPAKVLATDDGYVLTIEWSSSNYDYMIYNGEKLLPVNTEGNSAFELKIASFDEPIEVTADTVAMSKPHEIDYKITFGEAMGEPARGRASSFDLKTMWFYPVIGAGIGLLIGRRLSAGKRAEIKAKKEKEQAAKSKTNRSSTYTKKRKSKKR